MNQVCSYNNIMKKNFRFNLKFLDGLKKKPTSSVEETELEVPEMDSAEISEEMPPTVEKAQTNLAEKTSPNIPPPFMTSTPTPPPYTASEDEFEEEIPELPPQPPISKKLSIKSWSRSLRDCP